MKKKPPIDVEARLQTFHLLCKDCKLKVTPQRLEIYRTVLQLAHHPTTEDIYRKIRITLPTISIDTVYRTLALFERCGLISQVQNLSDKGRYDSKLEKHHHFICIRCQKIVDFYWPEFDKLSVPPPAKKNGKILSEQVELRGICTDCLKKS